MINRKAVALMSGGLDSTLAAKLILVLAVVAVAGQRDFNQVPRLTRVLAAGQDAGAALCAIAWLDRITVVLGVVIIYLGLVISRS